MRFKFEGQWEKAVLDDLGNFTGGGTPTSSNIDYWKGTIPWISSSDIEEENISKINISRYITKDAILNSAAKLCYAPVIAIVTRVGVGKIAYSKENICTSQDFTNITNLKCDGLFLSYLLSKILKKKAGEVQGTSIKGITSKEIKLIKLHIPSQTEQQKIASFLSLIDERISTQSKIIEGLKDLKASLSKQLFSRKLRFKDENGDDFPEWEERMLGEIGEVIGGGTPDTNTPEYWDGDINWFVPSEIGKQKYISSSVRTISHIGLKNSSAKLLRDGTILLSTRATIGEKSILNGVGCTNQGFQSISVNNENINIFIYYLLDKYKVDMIKNASGSTFLEISSSNLKKIKVFVPSFLEQQKIASILSAIDEKREIEKRILEEYTAQKKHLLKQMFI